MSNIKVFAQQDGQTAGQLFVCPSRCSSVWLASQPKTTHYTDPYDTRLRSLHFTCSSTVGRSSPSLHSIVVCLILSYSRWFPTSLLCHRVTSCLVVLLIFSLSWVATLCNAWSICCLLFSLYVQPISIFDLECILWHQLSLFFFWYLSMVLYLAVQYSTFSLPLLFKQLPVCLSAVW